jgi:hypothetical protein
MTKSNDTKKSNLLNNEKLELTKKYYSDIKDKLEFDVLEKKDNIDFHKYGPHIFHTDDKEVWQFINKFTEFNNYIKAVGIKSGDTIYLGLNLGKTDFKSVFFFLYILS